MPKLNATMQAQYEKALARGHEEGVEVQGRWTDREGYASFLVYSPRSEKFYTLKQSGHALVCSCVAQGYCKHRAIVREFLLDPSAKLATSSTPQAVSDEARERIDWYGMSRDERAAWIFANTTSTSAK